MKKRMSAEKGWWGNSGEGNEIKERGRETEGNMRGMEREVEKQTDRETKI